MKKLFIITGEASGDAHAAAVVKRLYDMDVDLQIEAIGGRELKKLNVKLFSNHSKMSAMGLDLKILFDHYMLGKRLAGYLINEYKPDLVLMIDYGGFNLNLSKFLKKAGLKIYYYIPPQIWASRKWRINTVKKNIDKVMTIFPFEKEMYEREGIKAEYVGHPLISQLPPPAVHNEFFEKYGLDPAKKLVAIFPGSRQFELRYLMKVFLKAKNIIEKEYPNVQFVISQAPNLKDEVFRKYFKDADVKVIKGDNQALLSVADVLMLASGTVALEAALYKTPMIISYRGPWIAYLIYRLVRCIERVCLPNIIMDKDIVPELLQKDSNPHVIAKNILRLLKDDKYREEMKEELSKVHDLLSQEESSRKVAEIISEDLQL